MKIDDLIGQHATEMKRTFANERPDSLRPVRLRVPPLVIGAIATAAVLLAMIPAAWVFRSSDGIVPVDTPPVATTEVTVTVPQTTVPTTLPKASEQGPLASGRDPLEVPYLFDLPDQQGVWRRIDDPEANFAVEPFSESRLSDEGTFTSSSDVRLSGITDGPGGLVAVGAVSRGLSTIGAVWRSADGSVWERVGHDAGLFGSLGNGTDVEIFAVASDADGYVAVGSNGDAAVAWTSADGVVWASHLIEDPEYGSMWLTSVNRVDLGWVATGTQSVTPGAGFPDAATIVHSQGAIWWSDDGNEWHRVESASLVSETSNLHVFDVVETEMGLFAVGFEAWDPSARSNGAIWFSENGLAWDRVDTPDLEGSDQIAIESITVHDGLLIAVGSTQRSARIWSSTDGQSWVVRHEEQPAGNASQYMARDIIATKSGFVTLGVSVAIDEEVVRPNFRIAFWRSTDGLSWSLTEPWNAQAYGFIHDVTETDGTLWAVGSLTAIATTLEEDGQVSLGTDVGAVWVTPTP